jgi:glycosyltransferase involved in cell wall biosynthesis
LRVLVATPSYPRFKGDYHGRFIQDLCRELARNGVELKVLAPRSRTLGAHSSEFEVERFPFLPSSRMEFLPERTMKGAPLKHLAQLPPYLLSAYIHMVAEEADIVHAHFAIPLGFLAALSPKNAPLVVTCHGSDCTLPLTNPVYRPFAKHALRNAEKVVAVSDFISGIVVDLGAPPEKVETIYLGVDTKRFRPPTDRAPLKEKQGIPGDLIVVGTLGRLVPEKRVEDLIRASAAVSDEIDVHFLVGGDGPSRPRLEGLARELGVENISFLGVVDDPAGFHQTCDVFVLSSVREGLSVSLQEAMAAGCVPVAVNDLGCPEIVTNGENGYLYRPGNMGDLKAKILRAASDLTLGLKARETIEERFDIGKNARRYVELYREVLSGR